jgi:penicillin-binding protein 1A
LTAGERLLPPAPDGGKRRKPAAGKATPGQAPPGKAPPGKAPRRRHPLTRIVQVVAGVVLGGAILLAAVGGTVGYFAYRRIAADLPSVDGLRSYQPPLMSRIYAGDGHLMAELATERRIFVPYAAIPDLVKQAFLSAEDQNFWTHGGVDPVAILRASLTDVAQLGQGRRPIGASTITQQVAKNMLLGNNEVTLSRKLREALLAIRIEQTLPKQRILELYLNTIYLGLQSYGVAAAAQAYFNTSLDQLTLPQAAFLAALPKAPNNYNPFRAPDAAKARRDWVIDRMAEDHAISPEQARTAKAAPLAPAPFSRPELAAGADWFSEEVRRQLIDRFGADRTTQGGLVVRTSLDPVLQAQADRALHDGLLAYDRAHGGWRGPVSHIDGSSETLKAGWAGSLALVARPPGMLADWQIGVVIDATDTEARIGWLTQDAAGSAVPHIGTLRLPDLGWARPVHAGVRGLAPHRIADVARPGDVVMVEPLAAAANGSSGNGAGAGPAKALPRLALRQIPLVQGALVSLDPRSGRILAVSGGWSFETSQFDRVTQAERQPGSSFKPMVYLTALEKGISPSQRFLDAPFVLNLSGGGSWRPGNYEGTFNGPTPLRVALEQSLNLVTIRVADAIGMDAVAQTAKAFHVVDSMPLVLPAALGAVDTTVLRQAAAYASLDEYGREVVPSFIDSVQDSTGTVVWRAGGTACDACTVGAEPGTVPALTDTRPQIADPQSVFQLITMMQGVVTRGTGTIAGAGLGRPIAGKTGTSQDFNDAWFVGFTPDLVTAVWVGFDQPQSLGENNTGGVIAGPIWHDFMAAALKDRPKLGFPVPDGVTMAQWDSGSGMVTDAFKPGQVPGESTGLASADTPAASVPGAPDAPGAPAAASGSKLDSGLGGLY